MNGPFSVIVKRTPDGWWRVTALYAARANRRRIARSCAGHHRYRRDAVTAARVVAL